MLKKKTKKDDSVTMTNDATFESSTVGADAAVRLSDDFGREDLNRLRDVVNEHEQKLSKLNV